MKKIKTLKLMLCLGLLAGMAPLGSRAAFDLRIYGGGAGLGGFDIEGTAVEALTGDDTYPGAPNAVETVTAVAGEGGIALIELTTGKFEFQQAFSGFSNGDSGLNNYGGAVSALLYPPATGTYILYVSSDDASQLFLSTDDKRANMQLIAEETGCCNPLADHPSSPVALEAGKAYYLEMLFKEGGGGDFFQVGWSLDGGPIEVIPGGYVQRDISSYALNINGVPPSDGLIMTPGNNTSFQALEPVIPERGSHQLVAEFDFLGVATIQWQLHSGSGYANIDGATSPVLVVDGDVNNDGNRYRVVINGETSPAEYTVSVEADTELPVVSSATHGGNPNGLLIQFSEAVSQSTATDLGNYSIDGGSLPSDTVATLSEDGLRLTLLGSFNFTLGDSRVLRITGITDLAASPNTIEDTEFTIEYSSGGSIINTEGLLSYWNFEGTFDDVAKSLPGNNSTTDDIGTAGSGVTFATGGPGGTYGLFDGNGDTSLVEIPNSDDILAAGENFSVTAWFRVDTFDKSWQAIVAHGEGDDWRVHRNGGNNDTLAFKGGSAEPTGGSPVSPINDGNWHHVAGTVTDGGETILYIDGQPVSSLATGSIANNGATRMMIGGNPDTSGDGFRTWNGGIDEVTLWGRALTEDEVTTLASSGSLAGGSLGPISIRTQPVGIADVPEHSEVTLKVETDGSTTGLGFQWYFTPSGGSEATAVAGATSGTYQFTATPARAGSYYAVARNWFSDATSETVSVSVVADTTAPRIAAITGSPLNNSVTITFSEPVDGATAGNVDNYSIQGLNITGIRVVNSRIVSLSTAAQGEGQRYAVSVSGVQDLAQTPNVADTSASFNSFQLRRGGLTALFYEDGGGEFTDFFPDNRGTGQYPDGYSPFGTGVNLTDIRNRQSTVTTYFESPATGSISTPPAGNIIDNYAQVIYGFLRPAQTGNYRFGLATDDNSEFYLSTDDDPANSVLLANETGWSAVRSYQTVGGTSVTEDKQSEPVFLEADKLYYVELIVAEGGGGDNAAVAWTYSADGDPDPVVDGSLPIPAEYLWSYLPVDDAARLISAVPANGATFVPADAPIELILFDGRAEVVDTESVVVTVNGQVVQATVSKSADGFTTITVQSALPEGAPIDVVVSYNFEAGGSATTGFSFSTKGVPAPPAGSYVSSTGLLNYWNFEGNAEDAAGTIAGNASSNKDDGSAGASVTFGANGPSGQFGLFDGTNDTAFVEVADSDDVVMTGKTLSISAWFRVDSFDKNWQALLAKGEGTDYRIAREGGNDNLAFNGGNGEPRGGGNVNDGAWHHIVAITEHGVASSLYIDGQLADSRETTGIVDTGTGRLLIGGNPGAGDPRSWNGAIDEVSMWNRVLTPLEIRLLAKGNLQGEKTLTSLVQNKAILQPLSYASAILEDQPLAFYRFEETDGQVARNSGTSGTANTGLWLTGNGPDDSVPADVSFADGPLPGAGFIGFSSSNKAASFTGPTDLLWISTQGQLLNNLPAFTLEYWVRPVGRIDAARNRVGIVGQNDAIEYGFINPTTIQIWTPGGGALDTTYSFDDGEWHHVATVANGTNIINYFDGQEVGRGGGVTTNYGSSAFNVHIGGGGVYDATGNHFEGQLDEVAIFNKAISAERVLVHYQAGAVGIYPGLDTGGGDAEITAVSSQGGNISISYTGTLQSAPSVTGPWTDVAGASSPHSEAIGDGARFFRVIP